MMTYHGMVMKSVLSDRRQVSLYQEATTFLRGMSSVLLRISLIVLPVSQDKFWVE